MTGLPVLSVQLYTLREHVARDRLGTLSRLAAAGFAHVEAVRCGVGDDALAEARRLRSELDVAGLAARWTHAFVPAGADAERVLDCAETIGADTIVVPSPRMAGLDFDVFDSAEGVAALVDLLEEAAENAAARGLRLGYHNHWQEFTGQLGRAGYDAVVAAHSDLLFEVDAYWAQSAGQDPAELVRELGDRVRSVHVKDGPAAQGVDQVVLGEGEVPIEAVCRAATSAEFLVIELDRYDGDPMDAVIAGARWLTEHGLVQGEKEAVSR